MSEKFVEERLARILAHEKEAVAVYERAFAAEAPVHNQDAWQFHEITANHRRTVAALEREMSDIGENPHSISASDDQIWSGILARNRKLPLENDRNLLVALKEGEQIELDDCGRLLLSGGFPSEVRHYLEGSLVPALQAHVTTLDQIISRIE